MNLDLDFAIAEGCHDVDINKKSRADPKAYFVNNAIPTESDFRDLIDGALSHRDDGITKSHGEPLSIEAALGGERRALDVYESFADPQPAWVLSPRRRRQPAPVHRRRVGERGPGDADPGQQAPRPEVRTGDHYRGEWSWTANGKRWARTSFESTAIWSR